MLNGNPADLISRLITLLIAFTFHEFAHAWTADRMGDDTPRLYGRLTLNPLAHLDFLGSLMLISVGFGWAKPVPVDHRKLRSHSPAAMMLVALSGPLSNFLLAVVAAFPLRFGWVVPTTPRVSFLPTPFAFLFDFLFINLGLMLFNLIPLPPLDGEEILDFLLPADLAMKWDRVKPYGPYILIFLFLLGPLIGFDLISMLLQPLMIGIGRVLLGSL